MRYRDPRNSKPLRNSARLRAITPIQQKQAEATQSTFKMES
jgi:hypothetical protein